MDAVKEAANQASNAVDTAFKSVSTTAADAIVCIRDFTCVVRKEWDKFSECAQGYLDAADKELQHAEAAALGYTKDVLVWGMENSHISYPALAGTTLLVFPATRRLLYRQTIGRFTSPEAVVETSQARVTSMRDTVAEYAKEAQKLEARMTIAEEELNRSISKLKATRKDLQRLAAGAKKSEAVSAGVLQSLRDTKPAAAGGDLVLTLRAEAASQVAELRQQRKQLAKYIYRITSKDI